MGLIEAPMVDSRTVQLSEDGKRLFFVAEKDGREAVFVDGVPMSNWQKILSLPILTAEGGLHYWALRDRRIVKVAGDRVEGEWSFVTGSIVPRDRSSTHAAWAESSRDGQRVVLDGTPGRVYPELGERIVISPTGKSVAYVVVKRGTMFVVNGENEEIELPKIHSRTLTFSRDGKHLGYIASDENGNFLVIDGKRTAEFPPGSPLGEMLMSDCGRHTLYAIGNRSNAKASAVFDGKAGFPFDAIKHLTLSAGGAHFSYVALAGPVQMQVLDGEVQAGFGTVSPVVFSADGKRHCYFGTDSFEKTAFKTAVIIDGRATNRFSYIGEDQPPVFSDSGQFVAVVGVPASGMGAMLQVNESTAKVPTPLRPCGLRFTGERSLSFIAGDSEGFLRVDASW